MDSKITEKIQQLLSMAEHPNSNENEAAVALEKAQALLLKHNLSRADILNGNNGNDTPAGMGRLEHTETDGYIWKRTLVSVLADANLCKVVGSPADKSWHLFGSYDNVRAVLEMYNWITLQLVWMANREYRSYKNDEGTERGQTWRAGFYQGAIYAIKERLARPMEVFSQGDGKALVVRNTQDLKLAMNKVFPHIVKGHTRQSNSPDGQSAGKSAGRDMALAPQRALGGSLLLKC